MPGVYGVPEQWPHVSALYEGAGFVHDGHASVYVADQDQARLDQNEPELTRNTSRREPDATHRFGHASCGGFAGWARVQSWNT